MAEADLLERVTHKVGPLPAWAWAAIPAVGYIGWSYYKASKEDTTTTDGTDAVDSTNAGDYGINTGGTYLPGYGTTPSGSGNLPYVDTPTYNNLTWSRQAINWLISQGIAAVDAVTAINSYINGAPSTINPTQLNALQQALAHFGPAPEGSSYVPTVGAADNKKPEAPTSIKATATKTTVTVTWGVPQQTNGAIIGWHVNLFRYDTGTGWTKTPTQQADLLPAARSQTFTVAYPDHQYILRVLARNANGYGPPAGVQVRTLK